MGCRRIGRLPARSPEPKMWRFLRHVSCLRRCVLGPAVNAIFWAAFSVAGRPPAGMPMHTRGAAPLLPPRGDTITTVLIHKFELRFIHARHVRMLKSGPRATGGGKGPLLVDGDRGMHALRARMHARHALTSGASMGPSTRRSRPCHGRGAVVNGSCA